VSRIIRVFPRRTQATPRDAYAFVGHPPLWWPEADEVFVSVTFTWDRELGLELSRSWRETTGLPTHIGGPALDDGGGVFTPGLFLKPGYTITSRGCDRYCWFCLACRREGGLRELPIQPGWNVCDDNLLACSEGHVREVFAMLREQEHHALFSGGLEAARLESWHVDLLAGLKSPRMYFAYDTPDDLEPLIRAGKMLQEAGFTRSSHRLCCYVIIGYPGDTFEAAEERLHDAFSAGFFPFAMLYRDERGERSPEWMTFQRRWVRPQLVAKAVAS
jgi:hypothetical protein